jgi:hypothetical protein
MRTAMSESGPVDVPLLDEHRGRQVQVAELARDLHVAHHGAARHARRAGRASLAASTTWLTRWMWEAKEATMILPSAFAKTSSKVASTVFSEGT